MRAKKSKTWKTSLSKWIRSAGAYPSYGVHVQNAVYEIEPVKIGDHILYHVTVSTGRHSDRVTYVTEDGGESRSDVVYRSPDAGREAARAHHEVQMRRRDRPKLVPVKGRFR